MVQYVSSSRCTHAVNSKKILKEFQEIEWTVDTMETEKLRQAFENFSKKTKERRKNRDSILAFYSEIVLVDNKTALKVQDARRLLIAFIYEAVFKFNLGQLKNKGDLYKFDKDSWKEIEKVITQIVDAFPSTFDGTGIKGN